RPKTQKNLTWIILLLLNPLVRAHRPCENPVTDDVNDIPKLIENLPNDYRITLKYIKKMESLPNHCWLHLMVPEFSKSLNNSLHKFSQISEALSNHSISNSLNSKIIVEFELNTPVLTARGHVKVNFDMSAANTRS
uniref:Kit ligand n=1 Tax=Crocodylus porosus TaxID=8502 RepID=A0A7M4FT02_CROPO